jgi:hypothetical protein
MWRVVVSAAAAEAGPAEFSVAHPAWEMCVIRVRCELDMLTVPTLSQLLSQELAVGYRALVVDLTDCEFAGSLGAGGADSGASARHERGEDEVRACGHQPNRRKSARNVRSWDVV